MIVEKIYSPIKDSNIKKDLKNSPIWKECYHKEDAPQDQQMYIYSIKFDGTKPIQCTKME